MTTVVNAVVKVVTAVVDALVTAVVKVVVNAVVNAKVKTTNRRVCSTPSGLFYVQQLQLRGPTSKVCTYADGKGCPVQPTDRSPEVRLGWSSEDSI